MKQVLCITVLLGLLGLITGHSGGLRNMQSTTEKNDTYNQCSTKGDSFVWADFHDGAGPHCVQMEARPVKKRLKSSGLQESFASDDFLERLKTLTTFALEEFIPPPYNGVGKVVSLLLDLFWPSSQQSIWDQVKEQVAQLVDQKILQSRTETLTATLNGIQATFRSFENAKNISRGQILNGLMGNFNILKEQIKGTGRQLEERKMMIPLAVATASMHLTVLRERVIHNIIYSPTGEDNTAGYTKDLVEAVEWWQAYFAETYLDWYNWRYGQITLSYDSGLYWPLPPLWDCWGTATDSLTGEKWHQVENLCNCPTCYEGFARNSHAYLTSKAQMGMAKTMTPTFYLRNFVPGQEQAAANVTAQRKNEFTVIRAGPWNYGNGKSQTRVDSYVMDNAGSLLAFNAVSYNKRFYQFQAVYNTHDGLEIGKAPQGVASTSNILHTPPGLSASSLSVSLHAGSYTTLQLGFSDGKQAFIKVGDPKDALNLIADAGTAYEITQLGYDKLATTYNGLGPISVTLAFKGYQKST